MKTLAFALLVLACVAPLRADEALQNGDFTDGISHWRGDGRSPADFASDNPLQSSDPFTSAGLIIPLKHVSWCKVAQDFKGKITSGVLTITYKLSPDFAFSDKPDDYQNIPNKLDWGWQSFNTPPGAWIVFIDDFNTIHGTYSLPKPKLGTSDPQTFQVNVSGLTPLEDKTITLAFPPGTGTVVILSVSLSNEKP